MCGQNFCLKILYHTEGTNIVYTAIYWSQILGMGANNFVAWETFCIFNVIPMNYYDQREIS